MEEFYFKDRPTRHRIEASAKGNSDIESDFVLAFLDFQWSYRKMQKQYDLLLEKYGLTESRFIILMFLQRADDHQLLPSDISEKLGASRPTVSKLLRGMEKNQLIERVPSHTDKRSFFVKLTKLGSKTLADFLPSNFSSVKTIFSMLDSEDIQTLNKLLTKIDTGTLKLKKEMENKNHANR